MSQELFTFDQIHTLMENVLDTIPISEQVAAWKKANPGELKVDALYDILKELFNKPKRTLLPPNIVGFIREDGIEMIRFEGPDLWGGAMPAIEWDEILRKEMESFVTTSSNFIKHD